MEWLNLHIQFFFFGGGSEGGEWGMKNVLLVGLMQICEAKQEMQTTVTNIVQVSPHTAQDAFFK